MRSARLVGTLLGLLLLFLAAGVSAWGAAVLLDHALLQIEEHAR